MARKFLTPIDLSGLELQNAVVQNLPTGSLPGSPADGRIAYDSTTDELKVAINGTWSPLVVVGSSSSDWKQSVRVVSAANVTLATGYENGDVIDGVTLATGDRILIAAQTTASENGIYTVNASGAPTRANDAASSAQLTIGARVYVEAGTNGAGSTWTYTSGAFTAQVWISGYGFYAGSTITGSTSGVPILTFGSPSANGQLSATNFGLFVLDVGSAAVSQNSALWLRARDGSSASTTSTVTGLPTGTVEIAANAAANGSVSLLPGGTGTIVANSKKITSLADPTNPQDAATKNYVDTNTITSGLDWKASVRIVSFANVALATGYENGDTVDGVTLATGDRILLAAQTTASENGIYTVNASGAPTRTADAASGAQLSIGAKVYVEAGANGAGSVWTYTSGAFTAQNWDSAYGHYGGITTKGSIGGIFTILAPNPDGQFGITNFGKAVIDVGSTAVSANSALWLRARDAGSASTTSTVTALPTGTIEIASNAAANGNVSLLPGGTGVIVANSKRITSVADPTSAQDAVTKNYVDNAIQGLDPKASVRVATTSALTFTVAAGAVTLISGTTIDGISPAVSDRILIKDAPASTGGGSANSNQPGNGIYVVTNNTTNLTVSRATDMDAWTEVPGSYAWVEQGTANADTAWVVTADTGGTLNTTAIQWVKFGTTISSNYYSTLGTGSGTTISIPQSTHNLRSSRGIMVQVQEESTGNGVDTDFSVASNGDVTITFAVSQTLTGFRVTLIG